MPSASGHVPFGAATSVDATSVSNADLRPSVRARTIGTVAAAPAIWLIRAYQLVLSPMRPQTCRFYPSCSAYALTAIRRFGVIRGSWLAARRLLRCHPWNPGGVDHVPPRDAEHMSEQPTDQT